MPLKKSQGMRSMTPRFWAKLRIGQALDWLYPDGERACVLCHRSMPDEHILARIRRSERKPTPGKLALWDSVCPLCLQESSRLRPSSIGRSLVVSYGPYEATAKVSVYSRFTYEGLVQRLIRPWKYDGALGLGIWFAEELAQVQGLHQWRQYDAIVPVPTSPERLKFRGYHHTLLLGQKLSEHVGVPVRQVVLRKSGAETQTAKSAEQRQQVVQSEMLVPNPGECRGKRFLLLDDVVTTGSTLYGCAQKLLEAGAASVACLVIAYVK